VDYYRFATFDQLVVFADSGTDCLDAAAMRHHRPDIARVCLFIDQQIFPHTTVLKACGRSICCRTARRRTSPPPSPLPSTTGWRKEMAMRMIMKMMVIMTMVTAMQASRDYFTIIIVWYILMGTSVHLWRRIEKF